MSGHVKILKQSLHVFFYVGFIRQESLSEIFLQNLLITAKEPSWFKCELHLNSLGYSYSHCVNY